MEAALALRGPFDFRRKRPGGAAKDTLVEEGVLASRASSLCPQLLFFVRPRSLTSRFWGRRGRLPISITRRRAWGRVWDVKVILRVREVVDRALRMDNIIGDRGRLLQLLLLQVRKHAAWRKQGEEISLVKELHKGLELSQWKRSHLSRDHVVEILSPSYSAAGIGPE